MRPWAAIAALYGLSAVALGAFAAHGLAGDAQALAERASQYQLLHALALLATDRFVAERRRFAGIAAALFTAGIALFSGSLLVKALGMPLPVPMITPAGGISLMLGWAALMAAALTPKNR
jgi:uncharacterized membrane protein YgdD (TMEM256/DUF423 family)